MNPAPIVSLTDKVATPLKFMLKKYIEKDGSPVDTAEPLPNGVTFPFKYKFTTVEPVLVKIREP
jgi:hypothetical protein